MRTSVAHLLDGSAIGLSGLCLAHCLVLPLLASLLPVLGAWARAEWVHLAFVAIAAPAAVLALLRPVRGASAPPGLLALGLGGVGLLAVGAAGSEALETPVTVAGSLVLASAHVWNWRRRGACATQPAPR